MSRRPKAVRQVIGMLAQPRLLLGACGVCRFPIQIPERVVAHPVRFEVGPFPAIGIYVGAHADCSWRARGRM